MKLLLNLLHIIIFISVSYSSYAKCNFNCSKEKKTTSLIFEHNSKWFLLGTSIIPFNEIPLRGTFAVQLSDHIDNYKLNNLEELKWVFRLSLGF